jgi:hypothetical protein
MELVRLFVMRCCPHAMEDTVIMMVRKNIIRFISGANLGKNLRMPQKSRRHFQFFDKLVFFVIHPPSMENGFKWFVGVWMYGYCLLRYEPFCSIFFG